MIATCLTNDKEKGKRGRMRRRRRRRKKMKMKRKRKKKKEKKKKKKISNILLQSSCNTVMFKCHFISKYLYYLV